MKARGERSPGEGGRDGRTVRDALDAFDPVRTGEEMHAWIARLLPLCRSITGEGLRETLRQLRVLTPVTLTEVPSGTDVFDWKVPLEWNVREAFVADATGRRIIDLERSSLHLVGYSTPVRRRMTLDELRPHLHTLPSHPQWIPYRTSYYDENWGFCLPQSTLDAMAHGTYDVVIDSTLAPGSMTLGECVLPGEVDDEVLVSAHSCHPSMANDNLSAMVVAAFLARTLGQFRRRFAYRFLFAPGTIGAIAWLALNPQARRRVRAGLSLACLGDSEPLTYHRTRRGDAELDRIAEVVLQRRPGGCRVLDFAPYGDERQFCAPGIDMPVGVLTRSGHGASEMQHTSADDLGLVLPSSLAGSLRAALEVVHALESNALVLSLGRGCEPQLGRRGVYRDLAERPSRRLLEAALPWLMSLADGAHTIVDIARRSSIPFEVIEEAAGVLARHELLRLDEIPAARSGAATVGGAR